MYVLNHNKAALWAAIIFFQISVLNLYVYICIVMFLKYRQNWYFYSSFNESYKSTGIFTDFRKAFDLANHEVLLKTLELGLLDYWLDNVPG